MTEINLDLVHEVRDVSELRLGDTVVAGSARRLNKSVLVQAPSEYAVFLLNPSEAGTIYDALQAMRGHQGGRLSEPGFMGRVDAIVARMQAELGYSSP